MPQSRVVASPAKVTAFKQLTNRLDAIAVTRSDGACQQPRAPLVKPMHFLTRQSFQHAVFYALASFIFYLAVSPYDYPIPSSSNDKINHFMAFMMLAILLSQVHRRLGKVASFTSLAIYGLVIEVAQHFLPYRNFSVFDWLTDLGGISVGLLLAGLLDSWLKRRLSP